MNKQKCKLVYGWGINDVDYITRVSKSVQNTEGKKKQKQVWSCPYYNDWNKMLERCFSAKHQEKYPTYKDCTVHEDWKYLSNFIKWVDSQPNRDWMNCQLDKDLLIDNNKHYGPNTCVYISGKVNSFIIKKTESNLMMGVYHSIRSKLPYRAYCSNPFAGKLEWLGLFRTELEAHLAWKAKKYEHACNLADLQSDKRVAKRLREMYAPDTDWTNR